MTYAITYANSTSNELVWKTKPKVYYTADNYLWYMFDINSHQLPMVLKKNAIKNGLQTNEQITPPLLITSD